MRVEPPSFGPPSLGPVSAVVERGLAQQVQRRGVVLWYDPEGDFEALAQRLEATNAERAFPVLAFDGSFLSLWSRLAKRTDGAELPSLALYLGALPPDLVRASPLFDVAVLGVEHRAVLTEAIHEAAVGVVTPKRLQRFLSAGPPSLAVADQWLSAAEDDEGELFTRLRLLGVVALIESLFDRGSSLARELVHEAAQAALFAHWSARLGMPPEWRGRVGGGLGGPPSLDDLCFAATSWAMCVEYVDDLRRPPLDPLLGAALGLPRGVVAECRALTDHLRGGRDRAAFYQRTADEVQGWLARELHEARAEDLGSVDTFRFEEGKIYEAALADLGAGRFEAALAPARARADEASFWLARDTGRRLAWELLALGAGLGRALEVAGPRLAAADHEDALRRYVQQGAAVDRAHRRLEQRRVAVARAELPGAETLNAHLSGLGQRWLRWANQWAVDFNTLCEREGFLPPAAYQQRRVFDDVVRPLVNEGGGAVALFLVDALRFELAESLLEDTNAQNVSLRRGACFAELPTITAVGMNALAPVSQGGRLKGVVRDGQVVALFTGEFQVRDPESRRQAMEARLGGGTCPGLSVEQALARDPEALRQLVRGKRLIVVHDDKIDRAGESGAGLASFDEAITRLRAAWRRLHEAGVSRFVFTADHGFLLLDPNDKTRLGHGRGSGPQRRHMLRPGPDVEGEVSQVALSAMGWDDVGDTHLLLPKTTALFDRGDTVESFVHGGNSLQERVIPVFVATHRAPAGGNTLRYVVQAKAGVARGGLLLIEARVLVEGGLAFGGARELLLTLRVDDPELPPEVMPEVELVQVSFATLSGGGVLASLDKEFSVLFHLVGQREGRARLTLAGVEGGPAITPCVIGERFPVSVVETPQARAQEAVAPPTPPAPRRRWTEDLEDERLRRAFVHLDTYGALSEADLHQLLGPRGARIFATQFDKARLQAPYDIQIETHGNQKRYVRVGSEA